MLTFLLQNIFCCVIKKNKITLSKFSVAFDQTWMGLDDFPQLNCHREPFVTFPLSHLYFFFVVVVARSHTCGGQTQNLLCPINITSMTQVVPVTVVLNQSLPVTQQLAATVSPVWSDCGSAWPALLFASLLPDSLAIKTSPSFSVPGPELRTLLTGVATRLALHGAGLKTDWPWWLRAAEVSKFPGLWQKVATLSF